VFLPQIILLWSMFGYMDFLIVVKWNTNYAGVEGQAPDIKSTMVAMFLGGEIDATKLQFYTGQAYIQRILMVIIFLCVPWMLCATPYLTYYQRKARDQERKVRGDFELQEIEMGQGNKNEPQVKEYQ